MPENITYEYSEKELLAELARRNRMQRAARRKLRLVTPVKTVKTPVKTPTNANSRAAPNTLTNTKIENVVRPRGLLCLSVKDAAIYLGISTRSMWRLLEKHEIPRVALPGINRTLVDVRDIDQKISASKW